VLVVTASAPLTVNDSLDGRPVALDDAQRGVSLSVPVILAPGGAREVHELALSEPQAEALRAGAEFVRSAADGLGS
jgi:hypothetical protein